MSRTDIPFIDPNVEHVGVSRLRQLDGKSLRKVDKTLVIREHEKPLAVLIGYEQYLIIQNQLQAVMETLDILTDPEERQLLLAGLQEVNSGNTKSIEEIRQSLRGMNDK
ncbi:MAG TPA: hypothetical protein VKV15_00935 [Bryobacteraceae bacterium]|nr:hypothetical protein [Bryobacteraceae bacterium]